MFACQPLQRKYAAMNKVYGCWCTNSSMSNPVDCEFWAKNLMVNLVESVILEPVVQLVPVGVGGTALTIVEPLVPTSVTFVCPSRTPLGLTIVCNLTTNAGSHLRITTLTFMGQLGTSRVPDLADCGAGLRRIRLDKVINVEPYDYEVIEKTTLTITANGWQLLKLPKSWSVFSGDRIGLLTTASMPLNCAVPSTDFQSADLISNLITTLNVGDIITASLLSRSNVRFQVPYSVMGPVAIHPRIRKEAALGLVMTLHNLCKHTVQIGTLPEAWKVTAVIPIIKAGDHHSPASYRPISLTSIECKILERLLRHFILKYFFSNNLSSSTLHDFLPDRLYITNMLIFMDSLKEAKDNDHISDATFDFTKASDHVSYSPVVHKLET
ncbi:uncharacterized protein DEA37_0013205 [Paragonimus westermani]|uniref:Reverse transcriptase domain-containing protein n=1 Tax=Paragonimus westermani TaxID=34504 RepID=A0A5J4NS18_9TREM|nr:uncharacterized protein DEA37_0013205 [Paragonimus westermani]